MDQHDKDEAQAFARQIEDQGRFEDRVMRLPDGAGARRETTFQRDTRIKRFNALGCGG